MTMGREVIPGRGNSMSKGTEAKNTAIFGATARAALKGHNPLGDQSGGVRGKCGRGEPQRSSKARPGFCAGGRGELWRVASREGPGDMCYR